MISSPSHDSPLHSCPFLACFLTVPYFAKHNWSVDLLSAKSYMWRASLTCVINETHSSTTVLISALSLHIFFLQPNTFEGSCVIHSPKSHFSPKSIYETCRLVSHCVFFSRRQRLYNEVQFFVEAAANSGSSRPSSARHSVDRHTSRSGTARPQLLASMDRSTKKKTHKYWIYLSVSMLC